MSIAADITTLELIAAVHLSTLIDEELYEHVVHRLQEQVPHFDSVVLYLIEDGAYVVKARAGEPALVSLTSLSLMHVPIETMARKKLGKIVVTARAHGLDESDYASVEALAHEIGKKLTICKQR